MRGLICLIILLSSTRLCIAGIVGDLGHTETNGSQNFIPDEDTVYCSPGPDGRNYLIQGELPHRESPPRTLLNINFSFRNPIEAALNVTAISATRQTILRNDPISPYEGEESISIIGPEEPDTYLVAFSFLGPQFSTYRCLEWKITNAGVIIGSAGTGENIRTLPHASSKADGGCALKDDTDGSDSSISALILILSFIYLLILTRGKRAKLN